MDLREEQNKIENAINDNSFVVEALENELKKLDCEDIMNYNIDNFLEERIFQNLVSEKIKKEIIIKHVWYIYEEEIERLFSKVNLEDGTYEFLTGAFSPLCYNIKLILIIDYILLKMSENIELDDIKNEVLYDRNETNL